MKRISNIFLIGAVAILFCSCKDDGVSLGDVKYHPGFLWVDAEMTPVKKVFDFDFSKDAKEDSSSFAEFQFVDNDGNPLAQSEMQVFMDGHQLQDNKFVVKSNVTSKELEFTFSPETKEGKHQGFLKLINHQLDRLDSQPLSKGQKVDVFQWTLNFKKVMNPLAKVFLWLLVVVLSCLIIWFIFLRPIYYPKFKSIRKGIYLKNCSPITINFKGARLVILDNKSHKQSNWDKIFKGRIIYKQHPSLLTQITMKPHRRGVMVVTDSAKYIVTPNPMPQIGSAIMNDLINRTNIEIK